jgi:hypothetical protein
MRDAASKTTDAMRLLSFSGQVRARRSVDEGDDQLVNEGRLRQSPLQREEKSWPGWHKIHSAYASDQHPFSGMGQFSKRARDVASISYT